MATSAPMRPGDGDSSCGATGELRSIDVGEFVRRLFLDGDDQDKRFALFLGAGCSVTSGIPAAGALVRDRWLPRLRDIRDPSSADHEAWAIREVPDYRRDDPGASYGRLIDLLFFTPDERQREIESLCDGRTPGFGYAVLAQLVAKTGGRFNVVLTTNFDDLVADALYLYTDSRPLVIHHESLAAFIRPTRTRPIVVKLHGDHRLAPRNTLLETQEIEAEIARHTAMVLNDRGMIFLGYGGNDQGIHKLLAELPSNALPFGAYWVHPNEPTGAIRACLIQRNGIWVKSGWFDEVMLLARNTFKLPHPEPKRFTKIFSDYQEAFRRLSAAIESKPTTGADVATLKAAVKATERSFPDHWKAVAEALRLEKTDPRAAEEVYSAGLCQFPDAAPLLVNFGVFLAPFAERRVQAEDLYRRALVVDPEHALGLGNYALLLEQIPGRREEAETLYKRAVEADPGHGGNLGNYAVFLAQIPTRREEAETLYRRAIEADPTHANNLGNYAVFLENASGGREDCESFYKRAIEADPKHADNLGNYADFLEKSPGRRDEAEPYYKRAIEAGPTHAIHLENYANYLHTDSRRRDDAGPFYKRSIDADPKYVPALCRYADWLEEVRGDHESARELRERAKALE